jgi:hypothetical protein
MVRTTNRVRLRMDLALTDVDSFASVTPARRQLLVPAVPAIGTDRLRPILLASESGLSARFGSAEPLDS